MPSSASPARKYRRRSRSRTKSPSPHRRSKRNHSASRSPAPPSRSRRSPESPIPASSRRRERSESPDYHSRRRRSRSGSRHRGDRDDPIPCKVIGVFGLNYRTSERDLDREFSRYGEIDRVQLVRDPDGRSRGFAFINYVYMEDARKAKEAMCDKLFDGKRIRVDFSISNGPHAKTPGKYMGRSDRRRDRYDRGYDDYGSRGRYERSPSPRGRYRSYSPRRYY